MQTLDRQFLYIEKPESEFDTNIVNMEFKKCYEKIDEKDQNQLEFNFLLKYVTFIADNLEQSIEQTLIKLSKVMDKISTESIYRVFYILHSLFMKETYLGPSFSYVDADKRLKYEKQEKSLNKLQKKFPIYDFENLLKEKNIEIDVEQKQLLKNNIKNLNNYNYKFIKSNQFIFRQEQSYQDYLEVDGEQWQRLLGNTHIFILAKYLILYLKDQRSEESIFFSLWFARYSYFHNNVLFNPTGTLKDSCVSHYKIFLEEVFGEKTKEKYLFVNKIFHSLLNVEYSNVLLFFYQYNQSQEMLTQTQKILKVSFNFTGKMGVRTKFQTNKVAQLVVQVINEEEKEEVEKENRQSLNPYDVVNNEQDLIKNEQFDEENILLNKMKLDEDENTEEKNVKSDMSLVEQILLLGIIKHLDITNPHDEVYQEQIQAYCNLLTEKSHNWLVYTQSLFIRSINEFEKFKRMERALLQLQTLLEQFNDQQPSLITRSLYLFSLNFPSQNEIKKIIAKKYLKVGMLKTACDIYESLEMYEECVECYANSGEMKKAKDMSLEYIQKHPNSPKMLCIYGDIAQDMTYYKKAWKVSGKRFARAQRSLGRVYFYSGKLEKAVKAFTKATQINALTPDPFFTMGCAYLKLKEWKKAVRAFSSVICINDSYGDAWANMATAFMQMGKKEESFSTLEQAVKHNETNWMMWANLLQVSFMNKKFYKFFECIQRLITLQKGMQVIDEVVLKNLNQIFTYHITLYPKSQYKGPFDTIKERIERLYTLILEKCGQKYIVWDAYANFKDLSIAYLEHQTKYELYTNNKKEIESKEEAEEESTSKIKFAVSTKPTFKTQDQVRQEFVVKRQALLERIYELRLSSLNVLMVSGWENSKTVCEKMEEIIPKVLEANKEAERGEQGQIEMERLIKSVKGPMEKLLEKQIEFKL